jgi:hypothetical protein
MPLIAPGVGWFRLSPNPNALSAVVQCVPEIAGQYTATKRDKAYSHRQDKGMSIPFRDPEPDEAAWKEHAKDIANCRGVACFSALAQHFGTTSPTALERHVDGRMPYVTAGGDQSISGKYRAWLHGSIPNDETCEWVRLQTENAVRLKCWRDHPLWRLLERDPPAIEWLHRQKEALPPKVGKFLFLDGIGHDNRYIHVNLTRSETLRLRNVGTLDAFVALLCLAREGETMGDHPKHYLSSACAFDAFPRVLITQYPLRFRWESLYACLNRVFFRRLYGHGSYFEFKRESVYETLSALDEDPKAKWAMKSGR